MLYAEVIFQIRIHVYEIAAYRITIPRLRFYDLFTRGKRAAERRDLALFFSVTQLKNVLTCLNFIASTSSKKAESTTQLIRMQVGFLDIVHTTMTTRAMERLPQTGCGANKFLNFVPLRLRVDIMVLWIPFLLFINLNVSKCRTYTKN